MRTQQKAAVGANGEHGGDNDSGGEDGDGIATFDVRAKTLPSKTKKSGGAVSSIVEEASSVPPLMNPELPHLAAVLNKADVVIEIVDARDPLAHRSRALETQVSLKEGQRLLLVLNKIGAYSFLFIPSWFGRGLHYYGHYRRLPSRADDRVGCALAYGVPDTALPRRIVLSPIRDQT